MQEAGEVIRFDLGDIVAYVVLVFVIVCTAAAAIMETRRNGKRRKDTKNTNS